ncbi:MAG: ATP-binding protein [Treponema sp.]|jgi:anti-sigma regulatory factor (Ser/Thr protein kinase)|nr:ATP-binding protein [Treponema sp.]
MTRAFVFDYEITLSTSLDELDRLQAWIEGHLETLDCPAKVCSQIAVVTEEIFVNLIGYAYGGNAGTAVVRLGIHDREVMMQFEDEGIAFNPLEYPKPDLSTDIANRTVGNLGIYLTKRLTDKFIYSRTGGKNLLTVYKNIE